jgi:site-specific DNA-methyltransferase (adenine-specific)
MQQQMLFDVKCPANMMHIDDAAKELRVSIATIRNWVKTGYLKEERKKYITLSSFEQLKNTVIGKEKLNKRANKSLKYIHDHSALEKTILDILDTSSVDAESLSDIYEKQLSESYKNTAGVFYTPADIVDKFFMHLPPDRSELIFCDPCCGTGNFLLAAAQHGFKPSNIYGFDIDGIAVNIAKKRLSIFEKEENVNVSQKNFLQEINKDICGKFDVIFTNPPWGEKITKQERKLPKKKKEKKSDSSMLFFFACLRALKDDGLLGLLLQDAFFNISSFESARKEALLYQIKTIIDFGKPFHGLLTKAKGLVLQKSLARDEHVVNCVTQTSSHKRTWNSFKINPKSILNISCTGRDAEVIDHIFSISHDTLKGKAKYGLGIVTGNNKKYCISKDKEGYVPVYKGSDITKSGLKEASIFIPDDLSLYQQVAPTYLYFAKEKLIYRFISSELVFFYDQEQRLILNSANMLILDEKFPVSHRQLCALLNSKLMSWVFIKIFETHKVLRSDIEYLPVFTDYFKYHADFEEHFFLNYLQIEEIENGAYRIKK